MIKSRKNEVRNEESWVSSILVAVMLLAVAVIAEAQQPKKVPRIGYVRFVGATSLWGLTLRLSAEDYEISVTSREKTSRLNIAPPRERWTVSQALWPISCNSRSMS